MGTVWSRDYYPRLVIKSEPLKPHCHPRTQHDEAVFVNFVEHRIGRVRRTIPITAAWDLETWV